MAKTIVARWRDWSGDGVEHLVLAERPDGIVAEAVVIGASDGAAFALRYRVQCDARWRIRTAHVALIGADRSVTLASEGAGVWTDGTGAALPALDGALDVDIEATPFTNTLPIRRLGLERGKSAEIVVAYVSVPSLRVTAERQRYTRLDDGGRFRFEAARGDFTRDIDADEDGLVILYPGLFRRLGVAWRSALAMGEPRDETVPMILRESCTRAVRASSDHR
jgi:hypothetical protein